VSKSLKLDYFTIERDHRYKDDIKRPVFYKNKANGGTQKGRYAKRKIKELMKKYEVI
jgi:hypothetical protein